MNIDLLEQQCTIFLTLVRIAYTVRRTTTEGIESVLMKHLTLVRMAHRALFQQVLILESIFTRRKLLQSVHYCQEMGDVPGNY
jgi:hypothetical protein